MRLSSLVILIALSCSILYIFPVFSKSSFPDRSTEPIFPSDKIENIGELPERPGNIDVDPETGRLFFTFHPMGNPQQNCSVCELKEFFQGFEPFGDQSLFKTVLSIRVMPHKRLLVALDHKNLGEVPPTAYFFELETQNLVHKFEFPPEIADKGSMLNDFVVSKDENFLFIADIGILTGKPSIITLNTQTWKATKSLVAHESTKAKENPKNFTINGIPVHIPFKVGVDSIALSADGNTLYFGAIFDP